MNEEIKSFYIEETLKYLNHLSDNIGKTITEYDWREICDLIKGLEDNFKIKSNVEDLYRHCTYLEYRYKKDNKILANELFTEAEKLLDKYQDLQGKVLGYRILIENEGRISINQYDEYFGIQNLSSGNIENKKTN